MRELTVAYFTAKSHNIGTSLKHLLYTTEELFASIICYTYTTVIDSFYFAKFRFKSTMENTDKELMLSFVHSTFIVNGVRMYIKLYIYRTLNYFD